MGSLGQFIGLVCDMRTVPAIKRRRDHQKKRPTSEWRDEEWSYASLSLSLSLSLLSSACCCLRTNWAFKCNVITFLTPSSVGTSGNRRPLMPHAHCKLAYKLSRVNIKSNDKRVCQNVREAQKEPQSQLPSQSRAGGRADQHQDMMRSKIPKNPLAVCPRPSLAQAIISIANVQLIGNGTHLSLYSHSHSHSMSRTRLRLSMNAALHWYRHANALAVPPHLPPPHTVQKSMEYLVLPEPLNSIRRRQPDVFMAFTCGSLGSRAAFEIRSLRWAIN